MKLPRPGWTLTALALFGVLFSCGDEEPPAPLVPFDVPPILSSEDVVPNNDVPIVIDRSDEDTIETFTVQRVVELNLQDEVRYELSVQAASLAGYLVLDSGTLAVSETQPSSATTVYQRLSYTVDFCGPDFHRWGQIAVRLRLTDQVPEAQHEMFGVSEHTVDVSWFVVPHNLCP